MPMQCQVVSGPVVLWARACHGGAEGAEADRARPACCWRCLLGPCQLVSCREPSSGVCPMRIAMAARWRPVPSPLCTELVLESLGSEFGLRMRARTWPPRPSARAQSRLTGPVEGQSSEWPLTDDINPPFNQHQKHTNTSTSTSTARQHTYTHTHRLNAQAQSLAPNAPFLCSPLPLLAVPDPRSQHSDPRSQPVGPAAPNNNRAAGQYESHLVDKHR